MTQNETENWNDKGLNFIHMGDFEEAVKTYDRAIEINPENVDYWYNKGFALNELRKYSEAIEAYDKTIEIEPEKADAWYHKGLVYYNLGIFEEAMKAFDKAKEIEPDKVDAWYSPQVCNKLFKFIGFRWAFQVYENNLRSSLKEWEKKFDNINSIHSKTKNRIRPRVAEAAGQTCAYNSWNAVLDDLSEWLMVIALFLSPFFLMISMLIFFQSERSELEWTVVFVILIITYSIAIIFLGLILELLPAKIWYFSPLVYITIVWMFFQQEFVKLPKIIRDGIITGFAGGILFTGIFFILLMLAIFGEKFIEWKKKRNYSAINSQHIEKIICNDFF